jgi:uncharacterized cofD-like protein
MTLRPRFLKWLYPGMGVKRWLVLLILGTTLLALGLAYVLVEVYREQPLPHVFFYVTLQFMSRLERALILGLLGVVLVAFATVQLNRSLLAAVVPSTPGNLTEVVFRRRIGGRGPRVVAIGGGTGLSTLLRGLKEISANITAIVTVADDGGSSGRLRRDLGVLPPGDFRQCIAALAEVEPLMTQLFEYRFGNGSGLDGHSFGNLFIAAMAGITGNFEGALRESSRVLAVRGWILPSTLRQVNLCAELADATTVHGESRVPKAGQPIRRVFLEPDDAPAYPDAIRAILDADLIVIGPGSLYTSVLPNLLVADIPLAIQASPALKIFVCNVASQPGETDDYALSDYLRAVEQHVGELLVDCILVNDNFSPKFDPAWHVHPVRNDVGKTWRGRPIVSADVVDQRRPTRHDPARLAQTLMHLYLERQPVMRR